MGLKNRNFALKFMLYAVLSYAVTIQAAPTLQAVAPDFTLKSQSEKNIKLSEYRGQVVLVNFLASYCAPCRQEMPLLDQLYKKYKSLGFVVLGVNIDEDINQARAMLKEIPVNFPVVFDDKNNVAKMYNLQGMPSTFILDRNGKLRYMHKSYLPGFEIEYDKQVRALLRE